MDLKKWADDRSDFIRVGDGESITAVFQKAVEVEDSFNPGQTKINYHLLIDNQPKILGSMSASLARQMANIKESEIVKISRTGEARQTKWVVGKVVSKDEIPEKKEEVSEEDMEKIAKKVK